MEVGFVIDWARFMSYTGQQILFSAVLCKKCRDINGVTKIAREANKSGYDSDESLRE
jgi:hypothetical protein